MLQEAVIAAFTDVDPYALWAACGIYGRRFARALTRHPSDWEPWLWLKQEFGVHG